MDDRTRKQLLESARAKAFNPVFWARDLRALESAKQVENDNAQAPKSARKVGSK